MHVLDFDCEHVFALALECEPACVFVAVQELDLEYDYELAVARVTAVYLKLAAMTWRKTRASEAMH